MINRSCKRLFLAGVAACLLAPALQVKAETAAQVKKAIQAQYDKGNAAVAKKDSKALVATYTTDRISIDDKGVKHTVAEELQQMKQVFAMAQSLSGTTTIVSITVKGYTAIVQVKESDKVVMANPQTHATSTMVMDSVSDDTWVKNGATWLQKKSVAKSQKTTLDGKAITLP